MQLRSASYFIFFLFICVQGWFSPLWVAFAILIGGLLLDVLISVSLGVSALPVNIIIGMEHLLLYCNPMSLWFCYYLASTEPREL